MRQKEKRLKRWGDNRERGREGERERERGREGEGRWWREIEGGQAIGESTSVHPVALEQWHSATPN